MECPICFTNNPTYVINCGSITPHVVCNTCEVQLRMKSPATSEGRVLKCPMCRGIEKVPGKRTSFSYEYELNELYSQPVAPTPTRRAESVGEPIWWQRLAESISVMPIAQQETYLRSYPNLRPFMLNEIYVPSNAVASARAQLESSRLELQARRLHDYHSFCQSGNRETGICMTRGKTERKCSYESCYKFVCRTCNMCIDH